MADAIARAGSRLSVRGAAQVLSGPFLAGFRAEFEAFLDLVAEKRPSPCTVADGLEADWIAEACSTSWKEHRPVRIEEVRSA